MDQKRLEEIKERYPYSSSVHSNLQHIGDDMQFLIKIISELLDQVECSCEECEEGD